jgi:predicted ATPase
MQKIIIKNFGAIEYAEIEIKKVLVLIGEQASGKSTIAKLIYFFKSLRDDVFNQIYQEKERDYFDKNSDINFVLQEKFYNWFGSTKNLKDFDIRFYYSFELEKYLHLKLDKEKTIQYEFSENFYNHDVFDSISQIKKYLYQKLETTNIREQIAHEHSKNKYIQNLSSLLDDLFSQNQEDLLFVIAGRSATVSYSELFEKYLFANVQSRLEKNSRQEFQFRIPLTKEFLGTYGQFDRLSFRPNTAIEVKEDDTVQTPYLHLATKKMSEILKGEYINEDGEEKIIINSQESIYIRNASSGQQEVIRILQDIVFGIIRCLKMLRIVEEPEAHLFPVAQKSLIELLALMVNQNDDNQLIITTHSPYILSVFNNLLFAQRVVDKNPSAEAEVAELIPKEFWLKAKDFSAYSLGNSSIEEEPEYCESIFNQQTGAIKQNYLDAVSEMLGGDFNALYRIHGKTFRRK